MSRRAKPCIGPAIVHIHGPPRLQLRCTARAVSRIRQRIEPLHHDVPSTVLTTAICSTIQPVECAGHFVLDVGFVLEKSGIELLIKGIRSDIAQVQRRVR